MPSREKFGALRSSAWAKTRLGRRDLGLVFPKTKIAPASEAVVALTRSNKAELKIWAAQEIPTPAGALSITGRCGT
ncbi:hypothetical protein FIBSPDRAFT_948721 [Athelia psychrophila]|uniref:Uncharacterized protein n=1 Tax=Athelia psychrophila TaxID=1759441 RepID=A0A166QEP2_9AGAM|nr:hypothetical protein FIBSPDRAFT_948721 [Fibularhizoctonia sp. CBS 109695]